MNAQITGRMCHTHNRCYCETKRKVEVSTPRTTHTKMVRWLIKKHELGLKEQSPGESNSHPPAARELARFLLLHCKRKTQTVKNGRSASLGSSGIELVQTIVNVLQLRLDLKLLILIGIRHGVVECIGLLLQLGNFIRRFQHSLQSRDVVTGGILGVQEVNVQTIGDGDGTGGDGLHDGTLAGSVGADKTVAIAVVDDYIGLLDQVLSVEGYRNPTDIDIARIGMQSALLRLVGHDNFVPGQLLKSLLALGITITLDVQRVQRIRDVVPIVILLLIGLIAIALLALAGLALGLLLLLALLLGESLLLLLAQFFLKKLILCE